MSPLCYTAEDCDTCHMKQICTVKWPKKLVVSECKVSDKIGKTSWGWAVPSSETAYLLDYLSLKNSGSK